MITAEFISKSNNLIGFNISGHAGYDDFGYDIVCASISSAVQLVCNTITEYFKSNAEVSADENDGIKLKLIEYSNDSPAILLIEGLKFHIETLLEDFPKNIKVKVTEV